MIRLMAVLFCLIVIIETEAQEVFRGKVVDGNTLAALDAVTISYKSDQGIVLAFGITDENGVFSFPAPKERPDSAMLTVSCLGYATQTFINPTPGHDYQIMMKEEAFQLKDVAVKARKFVHSNDTTKFFVSTYARMEDQSIGDVLSNMPGFEVSPSGRISYNGKSVTDFYIEGMDLLGKRYGIATRNLSHDDIASVEVIENHQRVKAVEDMLMGTGTAVNLNLKEKSKMKLIGRGEVYGGASSEGDVLWDATSFISAFKAQYQMMNTVKSNNSGNDIALENEVMTGSSTRMSSAQVDATDRMLETAPQYAPAIEQKNSLFNQTHIMNNSQLWRLSEESHVRLQTTYTDQHLDNKAIQVEKIYFADSVQCRENHEDGRTLERKLSAQLSVENNGKKKYLKDDIILEAGWNTFDLTFTGDNGNDQKVTNNKVMLSNKLQYVKPLGKHIIGVSSSIDFNSHPENMIVEYTKDRGYSSLMQKIRKKSFYADALLSYGIKFGEVLVSSQTGLAVSSQGMLTHLTSGMYVDELSEVGDNDITTGYAKAMMHLTATWDNNFTKIRVDLPIDYLYYFKSAGNQDSHVYCSPNIRVEQRLNHYFSIIGSYGGGSTEAKMADYVGSPVMRSYRVLRGSYWDLRGSKRNMGKVSIKLDDYSHSLFGNISLSYSGRDSRWGLSQKILDDLVVYSYVPREQKSDTYAAEFWINKGIDAINGKVQLRGMLSKNKRQIEQNDVLRKYESVSMFFESRMSAVLSRFLSVTYSPRYSQTGINTSDNDNHFREVSQSLDVNLRPMRRMVIKLSGDWFMQSSGEEDFQHNVLSNAEISYTYKKWRLFGLVNNIFNNCQYLYTSYGNLSSMEVLYELRPRAIMVGGSLQF